MYVLTREYKCPPRPDPSPSLPKHLCNSHNVDQDTRFNPARAGELEDDATSAPSNGLVRQYAHRGPMSDEDVRACLSNIMYIHDKDLVMTMTIGDIVSEIPWGAQAAALLGEFGRNSTIKIGKYIR